MKKLTKLGIKKVTLRDLEETTLKGVAAGCCPTIPCVTLQVTCPHTCVKTCVDCG
jgi:hypothetical protein